MMVSGYMLRKWPVMQRIENLPVERRKKVEPLWTRLSELEFQLAQLGVVFLWSSLVAIAAPLILVISGFDIDHWLLELRRTTGIDPLSAGMILAAVSGSLGCICFWFFRGLPQRRRWISEIHKMIALDTTLPEVVAEVDPEIVKRFRKYLNIGSS